MMSLYKITNFIFLLLIFFSSLNAQNAVHVHFNPIQIRGINPLSVGLGYERTFNKNTLGIHVLYTKMNPANSGDGDYSGIRIVGDVKFPIPAKDNLAFTIFPTYWKTSTPTNDEPEFDKIQQNTRIKWGIGCGLVKSLPITKHLGLELIVGPEINQTIFLGERVNTTLARVEDTRQVYYYPRLRTDFKFVWKWEKNLKIK